MVEFEDDCEESASRSTSCRRDASSGPAAPGGQRTKSRARQPGVCEEGLRLVDVRIGTTCVK